MATETNTTDLDHYLTDDGGFKLTIAGTDRVFRPISARFGLKLQKMMAETQATGEGRGDPDALEAALDGVGEDEEFYTQLAGEDWEGLLDTVTYQRFQLIIGTLITWNLQGPEDAIILWVTEGKAPEPNRAQRRAKTTRTGGATTTKRRASGSGTSTRPKPNGSARKAAA